MSVEQSEGRWGGGRGVRRAVAAFMISGLVSGLLALGCASATKPKKACVLFYASSKLNLFDGEPHPITVYLYPLSSSAGFEQSNVQDLLEGGMPAGVLAPPVPITISPGEKHGFQEMFPSQTAELGVLADYYRAVGDPEGTRTEVVPARCGLRKPKLILSPKDVYRK